MPCDFTQPLRYSTTRHGRYAVKVADMIQGQGRAALRVTGPGQDGKPAVLWAEVIEVEAVPGFPVMHSRHDGKRVCYGRPSHPFRDMALRRAADLLEGRMKEAEAFAMQQAIDAAIAARASRRNQARENV